MKIDYTLVRYQDMDLNPQDTQRLRGFFGNKYIDEELVHNHSGEGYIYSYPKIQYKVIKKQPTICGIMEGADFALRMTFESDRLVIGGKELSAIQKQIQRDVKEFGMVEDYKEYQFLTPWLALNQKNIARYHAANAIERESMLKRILIGNILSMSKGLGYTVPGEIHVWLNLRETMMRLKGIEMKSFIGTFRTNFIIPDFLGLGKSVSRGYGTIKSKER